MNEGAASVMSDSGGSECLDRIPRSIGVGKCCPWANPCMQRHRDGKSSWTHKSLGQVIVGILGPLPRVVGRWARAMENRGSWRWGAGQKIVFLTLRSATGLELCVESGLQSNY